MPPFLCVYYALLVPNRATGTKATHNVCIPNVCMIKCIAMSISVDKIYEFHKKRTACHVACVNYFAGLVGYHFPEHDNDKNTEPMRTGYAYKNYAGYHSDYKLPQNYDDLFEVAHATHHSHATHHIDFYGGDVTRIPDVCLMEMICDWCSANFEQVYILHDYEYESVSQWFDAKMAWYNWTPAQLKTIRQTIAFLDREKNVDDLKKIWAPVTDEN